MLESIVCYREDFKGEISIGNFQRMLEIGGLPYDADEVTIYIHKEATKEANNK